MEDASTTPIDCPNCHARTLNVHTGLKAKGLTAILIPPIYTCSGCGADWMLGEVGEPGAVVVPEGYILVPVEFK